MVVTRTDMWNSFVFATVRRKAIQFEVVGILLVYFVVSTMCVCYPEPSIWSCLILYTALLSTEVVTLNFMKNKIMTYSNSVEQFARTAWMEEIGLAVETQKRHVSHVNCSDIFIKRTDPKS